jgi:uncharacterized protein YyaL (SSP411 family)
VKTFSDLLPLAGLFLFSTLLPMPVNAADDDKHEAKVRKPLPPQEEIAKLPEDGGDEFNRLIFSQSPYLLQHARNPVDWRPWGEEAFKAAAEQNKPVFLSIGYTTCHWCHVMEHESFEDEEVAKLINDNYIAIKVDREERPDIDEIYMNVTQGLTGSGGWPMTVIMTAEKKPFFAGTYFPKNSVGQRPGVMDVFSQIADAWDNRRGEIDDAAEKITESLQKNMAGRPAGDMPGPEVLGAAAESFATRYDAENGGFSSAPKFPVPPNLMFLLRHWKRTGDADALAMVELTLQEIRRGGVFDQVGLGVHRYSTDRNWLVPHFEKMLYDQALLTIANIETYQATGDERYAGYARDILTYVLRDMTAPEGAFYSAEDADSEGEEGLFYIWTIEEIKAVLGEKDGARYAAKYHFTEEGNFVDEASRERNGSNIPHLKKELDEDELADFEAMRQKLFAAREKRIHPQKDDKILTDWNGLMIAALAQAGAVLGEEKYTAAAKKAADFVLDTLSTDDGRLLKRYRAGQAGLTAHLEDYAFMVWGLLNLYEASFDADYLAHAVRLNDSMIEHFLDEEHGSFYMTADDSEELLVRARKLYGGAIPSGNAVGLLNLVRLHRMTANEEYLKQAEGVGKAFSDEFSKAPSAFPLALCGLDFFHGPSFEIVIAGKAGSDDSQKMIEALRKPFLPNKVTIFRPDDDEAAKKIIALADYTEYQKASKGSATAYVCQNFACNLPTTDIKKMIELLSK